jgi:uncharacterized protein YcgI (DUF1989 family)
MLSARAIDWYQVCGNHTGWIRTASPDMKINPPLPINRRRIEPKTGTALTIKKGQILRIIDVEGEQVSDQYCFAQNFLEECLSAGHTTDYNSNLFLSTGDILYSNRSNPMFTIVQDTVEGYDHIMLYAPCSQAMYEINYGVTEIHPNCLDNPANNLSQ